MNLKRSNLILLGGAFAIVLFFILFRKINQNISKHISAEVQKVKEELLLQEAAQKATEEKNKNRHSLISDDISPYMINAQRKSKLFKNQQYWDIETRKVMEQPEIMSGIRQGKIFDGRDRTPQQLQEQIERIEGRIKVYKQKVRDDPYDSYARQKLQDLYMLKSTVRILDENSAPDD